MDSMPKRHKPLDEAQTGGETLTLAHDVNVEEEEDRIGNLPDSILCHILSKLPTKYALGTAVLSTRWKHLFSQIPNLSLVIDDTLLRHPNSSPVNCNNNSSFINFMYHLLTVTLHDTPHIHSFYFHSHRDYGNTHIDAWISAVVRLNVEHIALSFESKISGVSPHSNIFRSTTLLHLALSQRCVLTLPSSVCLQNLKSILFTSLKFTDAVSVERVLAGCPVLQTLFLDGCEFGDMEILCISSPSLKHFLMDNCHHESAYELVLDTPKLELLNYTDLVARGYSLKNLKSLVKAYIDIGPIEGQMEEAPPLFEEKVANFVTACSETALLYLSEDSISAIHYSYRPMPTFHNLRKLKLGGVKSSGWQLLPHLLDRSPSLQVIVFMEGFSEHEGCYTRFQDCLPEFVPVCLSLHLRKVKVEEFKGNQDELKLIEYFLKTAQVLQKVKISSAHLYSEKQLCIWKKLFMLPRCSKNCQIELAELK